MGIENISQARRRTQGRVQFLNPVAAALTSWPQDEALGRPIQEVFRIINEKTREPGEDIFARVLREGRPVALAGCCGEVAGALGV